MKPESAGPVAGKRALTVMAYLAADSGVVTGDLRGDIRRDLAEMQAGMADVGPEMACVAMFDDGVGGVQMDCKTGNHTPRLNVNMGTVSTLVEFLDWAMEWYPAENYALIIGSHGSGPKADPIYRTVAENAQVDVSTPAAHYVNVSMKGPGIDAVSTTGEPCTWTDGRFHSDAGSPGYSSARVDADRAIAFDDGSRSFLSIPDLRRALEHGVEKAGKPFAVILMDACYMASFEVLHELQGLADYVVASPEAVPGEGMPYTALLKKWASRTAHTWPKQTMSIESLEAFKGAYKDTSETASLVAVDMAQVPRLASAMNVLGAALLKAKNARPAIGASLNGTEVTSDPDFMYLYEWLGRLITGKVPKAVREAAAAVMLLFWETETQPSVLAASWARTGIADDVTVYFPFSVPSWYADLRVSFTPWGEWVKAYMG